MQRVPDAASKLPDGRIHEGVKPSSPLLSSFGVAAGVCCAVLTDSLCTGSAPDAECKSNKLMRELR